MEYLSWQRVWSSGGDGQFLRWSCVATRTDRSRHVSKCNQLSLQIISIKNRAGKINLENDLIFIVDSEIRRHSPDQWKPWIFFCCDPQFLVSIGLHLRYNIAIGCNSDVLKHRSWRLFQLRKKILNRTEHCATMYQLACNTNKSLPAIYSSTNKGPYSSRILMRTSAEGYWRFYYTGECSSTPRLSPALAGFTKGETAGVWQHPPHRGVLHYPA